MHRAYRRSYRERATNPAGMRIEPRIVMPGRSFSLPRSISLIAGVWLAFSAVLWDHETAAGIHNAIVGALVATLALYAVVVPSLRRVNTAIAVWFIVATLFLFDHAERATFWHDAFVGFIILGASLPSHGRAPVRGSVTA